MLSSTPSPERQKLKPETANGKPGTGATNGEAAPHSCLKGQSLQQSITPRLACLESVSIKFLHGYIAD